MVLLSSFRVFGFQSSNTEVTTIDLQNSTITKDTEILLDADWSFYWKEFIKPGEFETQKPFAKVTLSNWTTFHLSETEKLPSFGYATYRLSIVIPKERPNVSLYIPAAFAASKLWINGTLISEIGRVGTTKSETLHRRSSQIIPLNTDETEFEIVMHVANFYHTKGGIDKPLILGSSQGLQAIKFKKVIADMIFIGCLGFIGIFFLIFFLVYWNKDKAILYFAILCMSLSYMSLSDRYSPFAEIFPSISWIILTKFEYIILFLAGTSASLFFCTIFSNFVHKVYSKIIVYSFYLLVLLVVLLPAPFFTQLLLPFLLIMIVNFIYVTFVIVKAIISNRHESILMLTSMLFGAIIFYFHIFSFLGENGNAMIYVDVGYTFVFLLLSMLLMTRFSNSFKELERTKEVALEQKKEILMKSNELSKMNQQLKDNLRHLKNSNAELESFNHIVSHDLKAPLVAMHSLVSFIEEDLDAAQDKEVMHHFKLLKDRVSKMYGLINGLLEYSKITKGKKSKELFSLQELLSEIVLMVDNQNQHTIQLPNEDIEIFTNKIELEHVFQNLLTNSIKHNDKDKAIITISFSKLPNEYEFFVRDNGPGIDTKYHTKIFEMFSKLNINSEVESTGIGLSIVKKIVSENHGRISVESEKGIGTTIKFSWKA